MPKDMERKLKATAKKRGYGKERTGAYVYGTIAKSQTPASSYYCEEIDHSPQTVVEHKD